MSDFSKSESITGAFTAGTGPKDKSQTPAKLLISAAVFGILFSYLFTKQSIGLNMLVFVLLLYAFAVFNSDLFLKRTLREEKLVALFTLPVVFLAAYIFVSDTFLNGISLLVILFVMFVQYMVMSGSALHRWYQPMFLVDLVMGAVNRFVLGLGHFISGSVNGIFKKQSEKRKGAVIGVLTGIVLLIIIVPILLMADPALSATISALFANINLAEAFLYIFMFLLCASAVTALVATANRGEYTGARKAEDFSGFCPVQGVTTGVALSMISVIYILYGAVQFGYFFLTRQTMASVLGLTSSDYAVRGFGELLFITCLNFVLIGLSLRFTKQKEGKTQGYLKALLTVLIAFNFVIMASSHMRLEYYEMSFGYTVARFISHSFMILLAILNVIMMINIYFDRVKAIKLFAAAALVYFCGMVAINPEVSVVRGNIQWYQQTGKLDSEYMFSLSGDAVSEACDFYEAHPELFDADARRAATSRLEDFTRVNGCGGWQSLNLANLNAYEKLHELLRVKE